MGVYNNATLYRPYIRADSAIASTLHHAQIASHSVVAFITNYYLTGYFCTENFRHRVFSPAQRPRQEKVGVETGVVGGCDLRVGSRCMRWPLASPVLCPSLFAPDHALYMIHDSRLIHLA